MECFFWRTRECEVQGEKCEITKKTVEYMAIESINKETSIYSPGYFTNKPKVRARYFCVYNVSLDNCPTNEVNIVKKHQNPSWPRLTEECQDYVVFYPDRYSQYDPRHKYCGEKEFDINMKSSSFLAVLWTDNKPNKRGTFKFQTTCAKPELVPAGSGDAAAMLQSLDDIRI